MKNYFLIFILFNSIPAAGQNTPLIHDESYLDKTFWEFKVKLEHAIINRDLSQLKPLIADKVFLSRDLCPNDGCTKTTFLREIENTGDYYWQILEKNTRFGFTYSDPDLAILPTSYTDKVFVSPSYIDNINIDLETLILGRNVNIRDKPTLNSNVIRQASYEKFKCDCNIADQTETTYQQADGLLWLEIKLKNGSFGYVAAKFTSSNNHDVLIVGKVNGVWKIISLFSPSGC